MSRWFERKPAAASPPGVAAAPVPERLAVRGFQVVLADGAPVREGIIRLVCRAQLSRDLVADEALGLRARTQGMPELSLEIGSLAASLAAPDGLPLCLHACQLSPGRNRVEVELVSAGHVLGHVDVSVHVAEPAGVAEATRRTLEAHGVAWAFAGDTDAARYPYADDSVTAWFDRPDAGQRIDEWLQSGEVTAEQAQALHQFVREGYLTLEGVISPEEVRAANQAIDEAIEEKYQGYEYGSSQRLEHLHQRYPAIEALWKHPRVLALLSLIYRARAQPCQTLTYVFGSQQDAHQDTIHLTPFPAGDMSGTWIALQDILPDSGELVVYPGSHREPRVRLHESGCAKVRSDWKEFGAKVVPVWGEIAKRYQPMVYRPKAGTVLVWHENLLHAGSVRVNQALERRALVIHSFAQGALVYYDSTGMVGDVALSS